MLPLSGPITGSLGGGLGVDYVPGLPRVQDQREVSVEPATVRDTRTRTYETPRT